MTLSVWLGHIGAPGQSVRGLGSDHARYPFRPRIGSTSRHTSNDTIDVIDCAGDRYIESIPGFTAVAGGTGVPRHAGPRLPRPIAARTPSRWFAPGCRSGDALPRSPDRPWKPNGTGFRSPRARHPDRPRMSVAPSIPDFVIRFIGRGLFARRAGGSLKNRGPRVGTPLGRFYDPVAREGGSSSIFMSAGTDHRHRWPVTRTRDIATSHEVPGRQGAARGWGARYRPTGPACYCCLGDAGVLAREIDGRVRGRVIGDVPPQRRPGTSFSCHPRDFRRLFTFRHRRSRGVIDVHRISARDAPRRGTVVANGSRRAPRLALDPEEEARSMRFLAPIAFGRRVFVDAA